MQDHAASAGLDLLAARKELATPIACAVAVPGTQLVGEPVSFCGSASYDSFGGTIVVCEWDWNNDGLFDITGECAFHSWDYPGTHKVQLRVTDDEGNQAMLPEPLVIVIEGR